MVGIVGPGAVGQMIAFYLQKLGPVQIWGRSGLQELRAAVHVGGRTENLFIPKKPMQSSLWIFATKAYDLESALLGMLPQIKAGSVIVLLANGYIEPIIAPLRARYPNFIWRKGLVLRGCRFLDDGSLALSDRGDVIWGDPNEVTALEKEIFQKLGPDHFHWDKDACTRRREKWIFNTIINTLSGAHALAQNAGVPQQDEFPRLSKEVFTLARILWPHWSFRDDTMMQNLLRVIEQTRDNENSMARDRRLGRRLESDFLSGYVHSVPNGQRDFPCLWSLHQQLSKKD